MTRQLPPVPELLPNAPAVAHPAGPAAAIARRLLAQRERIARGLLDSAAAMPRWSARRDTGDLQALVELEFHAFVDYLARFFATGEPAYRDLYIGEKLKQLFDPAHASACAAQVRRQVLRQDREVFALVAAQLDGREDGSILMQAIDAMHAVIDGKAGRRLRVLFVGDCLFLDLAAFLAAPLMAEGLAIDPAFATSKAPGELHDSLRALGSERFDLVFFSPFSYEFNPDYARALRWKGALGGRRDAQEAVAAALVQAQASADLIADLFDCPIYIHNAANVVLEESAAKRIAKQALTRDVRAMAASSVDAWLERYVREVNARSFTHVFVLDERALVARHGEHALGAFFYHSPLQHPARLGQALAETYVDILCTHAHLAARKVIACDLDNTLWEGVIGEGDVAPLHERQRVLQALKHKGVVLAISSKNDPANVHWDGNLLGPQDFVHAEINWQPKSAGVGRMQDVLNLKARDFVFLDDRRDERELMVSAYPEIVAVDATTERTWTRFRLWAQALEGSSSGDRTQMYAERARRKEFVRTEEGAGEGADQALFTELGLEATLRDAQGSDLRRVAELVNRTNQFNVLGTRTTPQQAAAWHAAGDCRILLADARDRFGDMGTVGILVTRESASQVDIVAFVLSCRVFGYAIETAMVNAVKRRALAGGRAVHGRYAATGRNQPCAGVYAKHGFEPVDDAWIWHGVAVDADAAWLRVTNITRDGQRTPRLPANAMAGVARIKVASQDSREALSCPR
jgi:FkbH-like protein